MADAIYTFETLPHEMRSETRRLGRMHLALFLRRIAFKGNKIIPPPLIPENVDSGAPVKAYVSWGRWVVDCDTCAFSAAYSDDTPFFFCINCGGKWRPVTVPADRSLIETSLLKRTLRGGPELATTRNWLITDGKTQTVKMLDDENDAAVARGDL